MLFDTHSHIYFEPLDTYEADILSRMREDDVRYAVQIGCNPEMNAKALELAKKYPRLPATLGIHPTDGQEYTENEQSYEMKRLEELLIENRQYVVGIGETGLDYYHLKDETQKIRQKSLFEAHIALANKHGLPVIIHNRDAGVDVLEILQKSGLKRFVLHCFSEDYTYAEKIMNLSDEAYFSISGIVTYKNATKTQNAVQKIPLSKLLIETDAPFLAPQPMRGKPNEPSFVKYTLECIQSLRNEDKNDIMNVIYENSLRFYTIQSGTSNLSIQ